MIDKKSRFFFLNVYRTSHLGDIHGVHDVPERIVASEAAAGHVVIVAEEVAKVHRGRGCVGVLGGAIK